MSSKVGSHLPDPTECFTRSGVCDKQIYPCGGMHPEEAGVTLGLSSIGESRLKVG